MENRNQRRNSASADSLWEWGGQQSKDMNAQDAAARNLPTALPEVAAAAAKQKTPTKSGPIQLGDDDFLGDSIEAEEAREEHEAAALSSDEEAEEDIFWRPRHSKRATERVKRYVPSAPFLSSTHQPFMLLPSFLSPDLLCCLLLLLLLVSAAFFSLSSAHQPFMLLPPFPSPLLLMLLLVSAAFFSLCSAQPPLMLLVCDVMCRLYVWEFSYQHELLWKYTNKALPSNVKKSSMTIVLDGDDAKDDREPCPTTKFQDPQHVALLAISKYMTNMSSVNSDLVKQKQSLEVESLQIAKQKQMIELQICSKSPKSRRMLTIC